jgi:copper chaperone CopZ
MAIVKIKGMSCQHCVKSTTKALEALPGISAVKVDLDKGEARYEGDVDQEAVKAAIEKIGFEVVG